MNFLAMAMVKKILALFIAFSFLSLIFVPTGNVVAKAVPSNIKSFNTTAPGNITLPDESRYLNGHSFDESNWSTVVDWIRILAGVNSSAANHAHVYTYMNYVNITDYQMLYLGFVNATLTIPINLIFKTFNVTIGASMPMQTILQHYKTPKGKDAFMISTFLLMATFQDTGTIPGVPDASEPLYIALTFDLLGNVGSELKNNFNVSMIPMTWSADGNHFEWGMSYYNLKTLWWWFNPFQPNKAGHLVALAEFNELTFKYSMDIDRATGQVMISTSYDVGPVNWLKAGGNYYCGENLTNFLVNNKFSLALTSYQASIIVGYTHKVETNNGTQVTGNDFTNVSDGNLTTVAGSDNERIMDTSFGTKNTYSLYNSTAGSYNATDLPAKTYIYPMDGMRKNPLVSIQQIINKPLPIVALYMDPKLVEAYNSGTLNKTVTVDAADYLFVVSYPVWYGLKVEHDPTIVAYIPSIKEEGGKSTGAGGLILLLLIIAVIVLVVAIMRRKRR